MKCYMYCLIGVSFSLYVPFSMAMQPTSYNFTPIIQTITLPKKPLAITSNAPGIMGVADSDHYTLWDYNSGEKISTTCVMAQRRKKVYFHPLTDKAFFPGEKNGHEEYSKAFFVKYDDNGVLGKAFYRDECGFSSGLFSKKEPILFMTDKSKLIFYDYEKNTIHFKTLKRELGTIFAYPLDSNSYFLCSDYAQKKMYRINQAGDELVIKTLFKFPFTVDFNNWVYNSQEELFFFINKKNRKLYSITVKDPKKIKTKKYCHEKDFLIASMAIHPNKKILVLLSQKNNEIQFVDIRSYENIRHIFTSIHELRDINVHNKSKNIDKKIIISRDGENVLITTEKECSVIGIPSFIKYSDSFQKISLIRLSKEYNILSDVRKLIWWFLLVLYRRDKLSY